MQNITEVKGNLFEQVTEGHIVHGCNAQGVMGSGFALQVKNLYPVAYEVYRNMYEKHGFEVGENISVKVEPNLVIHNAITQEFYGRDGKQYVDYLAVKDGFVQVCLEVSEGLIECEDIHFPLIGCGLGGGDRSIILSDIDKILLYFNLKGTLWVL